MQFYFQILNNIIKKKKKNNTMDIQKNKMYEKINF